MNTRTFKPLVRSFYDIQRQRVQIGQRIVAEIKARLGQAPSEKEQGLDAEAQRYLEAARCEYERITDAFVLNQAHKYLKIDFDSYQIISDPAMLLFVRTYQALLDDEDEMQKVLAKLVQQHPLWEAFFDETKGCGPLMAAVCLSEFNVHKARHASSFWKYAGLDVAADGQGRSRRKEHLVEQEYTDKDGNKQTKKGISHNPFLKSKLVGVLGGCFVKQNGEKSKYRKIYDDYKHRLENHEKHKEKTKLHRHNMAVRYAVKMFVQDLWLAWREIEGLPVSRPYHEAKLGHKHGEAA